MAVISERLGETVAPERTNHLDVGGDRMIAFVLDEGSAAALRAALLAAGEEVDIRRGTARQAIRFFEKTTPMPAVLVDIEGLDEPIAELDALAHVCPPDVKVFVIGTEKHIGFYRQLVHDLGVVEYIHKPLTRDHVERLLLPHLTGHAPVQADRRAGQVIAICGAGGGVGTTTIAVNLALELERATNSHVALLDLHLQGGRAAMMLAAQPGPGLRIALEEADRADGLFLDRTAIAITSRLRLIAAEEGFDDAPIVSEAGVARVLDLLRQKFNFVIVDLPMPLPAAMRKVIALTRRVIVVLEPNVASLRDTNDIRRLVSSMTGSDRVLTVINRENMKGGLQSALVEKGLKGKPDIIIPELGRRMTESADLGIPAVRRVPALRRHLASMVREISGTEANVRRSSLLAGFLRR